MSEPAGNSAVSKWFRLSVSQGAVTAEIQNENPALIDRRYKGQANLEFRSVESTSCERGAGLQTVWRTYWAAQVSRCSKRMPARTVSRQSKIV
jgi:hypothetical protein